MTTTTSPHMTPSAPFESAFRFKVGDRVMHASTLPPSSERFLGRTIVYTVVARMVEECYGGCQAVYKCRCVEARDGACDPQHNTMFFEFEVQSADSLYQTEAKPEPTP